MNNFDEYPKSIKKVVRYIKQDAPLDQLNELEIILSKTIQHRRNELKSKLKGVVVR
ncbi:hypothetical protein [Fictibacillus phosphorivorans]|uniref:hypothetical protein n=1 Tax=Fictibacillus phosphorivorans TaxID=1221500 RepID=UPI0036D21287